MMKKRTARDYKFLKLLGEGSFSSVYLAVDADFCGTPLETTNTLQNEGDIEIEASQKDINQPPLKRQNKTRMYAVKVCQKSHIKKQGKQTAIMREKEIMNILNLHPSPHFIKLFCTFQDTERLYFVMSYAENGDLLDYMNEHPLSMSQVQRYTLQLLDALEHIHKLNIIHRDLKPENILLDAKLNVLITDFGSARAYSDNQGNLENRRNSFVGTAQYVSPEMLKERQASNKSDLWAFGIIVYQMITNIMPFNAPNEYLIYQKIQNLDYSYPVDFDLDARDFVESLIKLDPTERLGASDDLNVDGYSSLRNHRFLSRDFSDTSASPKHSLESPADTLTHFTNLNDITPGLDEAQLLRLLTIG